MRTTERVDHHQSRKSMTKAATSHLNKIVFVNKNDSLDELYAERASLRIIILTYNRAKSLGECLESLKALVTDGFKVAMAIWIDRSETGSVNRAVLRVAKNFMWSQGNVTVYIHNHHVGLIGQWLTTWHPARENANINTELALFVEDDVDISRYAFRWLRHIRTFYFKMPGIGCYGLNDENVRVSTGPKTAGLRRRLIVPETFSAFLYGITPSWGMAPNPVVWAKFQKWYLRQKHVTGFRPYLRQAAAHTGLYRKLEKMGRASTMWTQWFTYFLYKHNMYCLHSNLAFFKGEHFGSLSSNRREPGLHFTKRSNRRAHKARLMDQWNNEVIQFPKEIPVIDFKGKLFRDWNRTTEYKHS